MSEREGSAGHGGTPQPGVLHVGVVHGPRSIHFVAVGETRPALLGRLAAYVREQAGLQLYGEDHERVRGLLSEGALEGAVRLYFERVGERWDREWLTEDTVQLGPA